MQPALSSFQKDQLDVYQALLIKWQSKINLVGPKTLEEAWERHFLDSLQLLPLIPENTRCLADLGSGAGFPGLVLAIMRPDIEAHLIESDQKKCTFMRTVARELDVPVHIHTDRIESVSRETDFVPDVVTARALASLSRLLNYVMVWVELNPSLKLVAPKGAQAQAEIEAAKTLYDFEVQSIKSETQNDAQVLVIESISRCV